jgi:hypothetical protein
MATKPLFQEEEVAFLKRKKRLFLTLAIVSLFLSLGGALLLLLALNRDNKILIIVLQTALFSLGGFVFLFLLLAFVRPLGQRQELLDVALHSPHTPLSGTVQAIGDAIAVTPYLEALEITLLVGGKTQVVYWDASQETLPFKVGDVVDFLLADRLIVEVGPHE